MRFNWYRVNVYIRCSAQSINFFEINLISKEVSRLPWTEHKFMNIKMYIVKF